VSQETVFSAVHPQSLLPLFTLFILRFIIILLRVRTSFSFWYGTTLFTFPRGRVTSHSPSIQGETLTFPFRFSCDLTPVDGLWNPFHQCVNELYSAFSYISARFNRLNSVRNQVYELWESVKSLETSRGDYDLQTLEKSSISLQCLSPSDVGLGRVSETLDRSDHLINGL